MLGQRLMDPEGVAGTAGEVPGLGLLPLETTFHQTKQVRPIRAQYQDSTWTAYEIHMGDSASTAATEPLLHIQPEGSDAWTGEGILNQNVWGTYLHGLFESPLMRERLIHQAGDTAYRAHPVAWEAHKNALSEKMADRLETQLNLQPVDDYVFD